MDVRGAPRFPVRSPTGRDQRDLFRPRPGGRRAQRRDPAGSPPREERHSVSRRRDGGRDHHGGAHPRRPAEGDARRGERALLREVPSPGALEDLPGQPAGFRLGPDDDRDRHRQQDQRRVPLDRAQRDRARFCGRRPPGKPTAHDPRAGRRAGDVDGRRVDGPPDTRHAGGLLCAHAGPRRRGRYGPRRNQPSGRGSRLPGHRTPALRLSREAHDDERTREPRARSRDGRRPLEVSAHHGRRPRVPGREGHTQRPQSRRGLGDSRRGVRVEHEGLRRDRSRVDRLPCSASSSRRTCGTSSTGRKTPAASRR